ncbi:MAG: SpoIIE family protein phosphatase [Spirochaetota bacterium]
MYKISMSIFLRNFFHDKVSIINLLGSSIDGTAHIGMQKGEDKQHPNFQKYDRLIKKIYKSEKEIRYIYTVNYIREENRFVYAIDTKKYIGAHYKAYDENLLTAVEENKTVTDNSFLENGGKDYANVYTPIQDKTGKAIGAVIAQISFDEITRFRKRVTLTALSVFFLTLIFTIIISIILAGYFTQPLAELTAAVSNIATGDLKAIVSLNRKDEFGTLAKNFNTMAENLKIASEVRTNLLTEIIQLNENLEKKVEDRTKTIELQSLELHRQIQIAKKIQTSLLPQELPQLDKLCMDYLYFPMMEIGGDFIDVYHYRDSLSIFMCDVSGHGVPAAFLATMVKMSLHECHKKKLSPSHSLNHIRDSLQGKMSNHFLSAIFLQIDLASGKSKIANAGHLPPILSQNGKGTRPLITSGRVINETFPIDSKEIKFRLQPGDSLVLYTDGITESKNSQREMYGEERLLQIIENNKNLSPTELCEVVYGSVIDFSENTDKKFNDDLTLFILNYST